MNDRDIEVKSNVLFGRKIALCVTGGIAAIETVKLSRELRRYGAAVRAYMTTSAQTFITSLSLEWGTVQKVVTDLSGEAEHIIDHDLVLVAPATLNTINKAALGFADNVVTTLLASAWGKKLPIVFVPTMHGSLCENPILKKNITFLKEQDNIYFINGKKEEGKEKFPEIETIIARVCHILSEGKLKNKRILITGGPTQAPIDPVRHIGNFSTGELSVRLAHELYLMGAKPALIYGPGCFKPHSFYSVIDIKTPKAMLDAALSEVQHQTYDAAIFAAAVLDHVPDHVEDRKLSSFEELKINFIQTPKIIREIDKYAKLYKIGFKLEWKKTKEELIQCGIKALEAMNTQVVIVNDFSQISNETHPAFILDRNNAVISVSTKKEIIQTLLQKLENAL